MKLGRSLVYAVACTVVVILLEIAVITMFSSSFSGTRWLFWIHWIGTAIATLLIAKWYFKQDEPTFVKGLKLGILAAVPLFALTHWYAHLWGSGPVYWKAYVDACVVLAATAYAGFEFDQTYTKREE